MQRPRILILTNRVPFPLKDGGNLAMKAMVDGYHANGFDVYLLSMNTTRHPIEDNMARAEYADIYEFKTVAVDNEVRPWPALKNYLFSSEANHVMRFRHNVFESELKNVLQSFKPDYVQVESVYLSTYLPLVHQYTDAKTILRLHNIEYQVWQRLGAEMQQPIKKKYISNLAHRIEKFEKKVWREYDLLLPITSEDERMMLTAVPDANSYVVPFTIDMKGIIPDDNEKWVGYHLGAMDWLPNEEGVRWFLREILPRIHEVVPTFKFYFAGRNMPAELKRTTNELVICEGEVEDAQAFVSDKKILIVPLRSGGGIRVKILEAMAHGKVVISTDIGMQGINAEPDKHYISANTAEEFTKSVSWCLANKDKAELIASNASDLIQDQYSTEVTFRCLKEKLFETT